MSTDTFLSWYTVIGSFLPLSFWVSVIVPLRSEVVGFSLTVAEFVPALIQDTLAEADQPILLREVSLPLVYVIFCEVTL